MNILMDSSRDVQSIPENIYIDPVHHHVHISQLKRGIIHILEMKLCLENFSVYENLCLKNLIGRIAILKSNRIL